ncbi:hypothetical protein [Rhizobium indicum]|uniref:Uncharacterized protein n=1 Tax=Rhizobium indicum TaxID=2583231 RepID=A0ABX6PJ19_9HYPH|nr:hypothetical protein [Rhizobium indicum]QKK19023.1 hypothetical protein FFM53_022310 [Rhizobium indicum]
MSMRRGRVDQPQEKQSAAMFRLPSVGWPIHGFAFMAIFSARDHHNFLTLVNFNRGLVADSIKPILKSIFKSILWGGIMRASAVFRRTRKQKLLSRICFAALSFGCSFATPALGSAGKRREFIARHLSLSIVSGAVLMALSAGAASAQTAFWTGATSSDWTDASNWSTGIAPVAGQPVTI